VGLDVDILGQIVLKTTVRTLSTFLLPDDGQLQPQHAYTCVSVTYLTHQALGQSKAASGGDMSSSSCEPLDFATADSFASMINDKP
jgi:hypothetical protein